MSSSTASMPTPTPHSFNRLVEDQKPSKTDINSVIMDYLIKEGYPDSARKFALEANIKQGARDEEAIRARVEVKNAIHSGQIQTAIERINELDPEILDLDAPLHFALLRLQLIEIIRSCSVNASGNPDISPAITFAKEQLAPRASINREFLHDLEQTMSLLVFQTDSLSPQLAALLKPDLRREVADRVNSAILKRQGYDVDARIKEWVKARTWAEQYARKTKKDIPSRIVIGLDGDEEPQYDEANGDAMVTSG
ncbi:uncharacterized protein PV09_06773 [Verruconis gallopava]|uniref:CTLH domain-containing protein n=1 Tax=Verruconis gallopava TaxID=253628 RepID=A0A0D2ARY0_9PEZI|nr:uncharacterized protein PV09_06773 [Verruconis gallopava]KIW01934.1 hypothetical protein PV09_06773 [Verruconis gallopava]